jgi:hypothetical protein
LRGLAREAVEEVGKGRVSERIPSGLHDASGVEIPIRQWMVRVPRRAEHILVGCDAWGGVKRASMPRSADADNATLWVYSTSVAAVGPFTATSLRGPILGSMKMSPARV